MALKDPDVAEKAARLERATSRFDALLKDTRQWENGCEAVFSEFRIACVHLRKDSESLGAFEKKQVVWRFLSKLSRERKPFWGRCEEVLGILMTSDAWMKAFVEDPEMNLSDLPTGIIKDFSVRCEEVGGAPRKHVRLVLIGCGKAAQHIAAMSRYNDRVRSDFFRLVAVLDAPEQAALLSDLPEASKLRLGDCLVCASLEELFEKTDFDAAVLASPGDCEKVLPALVNRKKFVLTESPLASSLEAALKLTRLSRQKEPSVQRVLVSELAEYWTELQRLADALASDDGPAFACQVVASCEEEEAMRLLPLGIGSMLVPGLQWLRVVRQLFGPVDEVVGMELVLNSTVAEGTPAPSTPSHGRSWLGGSKQQPETVAACVLRHRQGLVSSLRLQSCGLPQPQLQPQLVVNRMKGDLCLQDGEVRFSSPQVEAAPAEASKDFVPPKRSSTRSFDAEALGPVDKIWELFAKQVMPVAREVSQQAEETSPEEPTPVEIFQNLDAHLQDIAVAEAVRASFLTKRFETVRSLQI